MAAISGDVSLVIGGKVWLFRLDFNAMCHFEALISKPALLWIAAYERGEISSVTELRAMCWAMARRHQPEVTLDQAGEILDDAPHLIAAVINGALPENAATTGRTQLKKLLASIWRRFSRATQP